MPEIKLQVGVKIFLKNKGGKYLLVKRNPTKYPDIKGQWDIVGGRIDAGTELIDNLRREVKEETQLEILSEPKLLFAQDIIPNAEKHVVRLTYVGSTDGEPILDTDENTEYKWLSLEELRNVDNLNMYTKKVSNSGLI